MSRLTVRVRSSALRFSIHLSRILDIEKAPERVQRFRTAMPTPSANRRLSFLWPGHFSLLSGWRGHERESPRSTSRCLSGLGHSFESEAAPPTHAGGGRSPRLLSCCRFTKEVRGSWSGRSWHQTSNLCCVKAKDEPFVGKTHSLPSSQASR
jgi:hypothetical protein